MLDKFKALKARTAGSKDKPDNPDLIVGLDIGTEFVKALIGRIDGDTVEIIGMGRARQGLTDMQAGAVADIAAVVANCDKALNDAEKEAGASARQAVIGIAGELVKGTTTTIKFSRKDPSRALDIEEVERIVKLVQERSEAKARKQLAWEMGGKDVDIRLVNSALVSIEIDGYKITNPIGFQGRDVVVQLFTAFAPLVHIGALERTAHDLDLDLLAVAAEPFAVARSVVGNDPNTTLSALLMDVGGGTTDIALVNEGGVEGTKMFGIGGRAFTRSIERELGIEFTQAEAVKIALDSGKVPHQKLPAIEKALEKTLDVWLDGVQLALGEFSGVDHLPHKLLLCGGGSSLEMLLSKLNDTNWYTDLPFTRKPVIQHIQPEEVVGIIDKTGLLTDHTFITAMGLLRVGLDTMAQTGSSPSSSLRERINRLLAV